MQTYLLLAASAAFFFLLFAVRIAQLRQLHAGATIDPSPEILGPKEVHRRRL
jgi:hypothetical protein